MDKETFEELKDLLYGVYNVDDETADGGCYCNGNWLSVKEILETIERNMVY